jgi:hypothetical protein
MSKTSMAVSGVLALMATACASGPQIGDEFWTGSCSIDESGWRLIEAPKNADQYRQLAENDPPFGSQKTDPEIWGRYSDETWIQNDDGETVLCLTDGPAWKAWGSTFWRFGSFDQKGVLIVTDKGATITVG